ncbi:MAG: glycosyltransferase family 9 protein [Planctomycetota bacterium]|jgi:hypothetical protein
MNEPVHAIALFSGRRDTIHATPIAWQLKMDQQDCHVVWFTSQDSACILENNPHVDELVVLEGSAAELNEQLDQLRSQRDWSKFITPDPALQRGAHPDLAEVDLIRQSAQVNWLVPFRPVMRLSVAEEMQARRYWRRLPAGPKILVEVNHARSSIWQEDFRQDLIDCFGHLEPTFVFISEDQVAGLDEFSAAWPRTVWCREPFRLAGEFLNLCDAFISIGADYTALSYADCCNRDLLQVEVVVGAAWSGMPYAHRENVYYAFSRERYRESIQAMAARMAGGFEPDFSPRHPRVGQPSMCPSCGEDLPAGSAARGAGFVQCAQCLLVYQAISSPPEALDSPLDLSAYQREMRAEHLRRAVSEWGGDPSEAQLVDLSATPGLTEMAESLGMRCLSLNASDLDRLELSESLADIVFLPHVLQSQVHPREFLERVEFMLALDGIAYVTLPNIGSLGYATVGDRWPWYGAERNACHLPVQYLRNRLSEMGLWIEHCDSMPGEFPLAELEAIYRQGRPNMDAAGFRKLVQAVCQQACGEELRMVARKRGMSKARARSLPVL